MTHEIDRAELANATKAFLETQQDDTNDEWWCTDREAASVVLDKFIEFLATEKPNADQ